MNLHETNMELGGYKDFKSVLVKKNRVILLVLLGIFQISYGQKYLDRWYVSPFFHRLTSDDGLSSTTVNDILQDYLGFMWFATASGLDRYDGYEIAEYRFDINDKHSISNSNVSHILEDSKQRLWVGTLNGLNLYNREKNHFIRFVSDSYNTKSISSNQIEDIIEDSKGNLWIATYEGLNLFNESDSSFTKFLLTPDQKDKFAKVRSLLEDKAGNLWVGTHVGGLCKFNPSTGACDEVYSFESGNQNGIPSNLVWDLFEDRKGNFWVSTFGTDVSLFDRSTGEFTNLRSMPKGDSTIEQSHAWTIREGMDGKVWLGMDNKLLIWDGDIKNPNKFIEINGNPENPENSLSVSNLLSIYQSDDGLVWIGSRNGGISYISKNSIRFFHFDQKQYDFNNSNITCFAEGPNDDIWIGIDGGGLRLFDPERNIIQPIQYQSDSHNSKSVLDLVPSDKGMWVGMWGGGMEFYDYEKQEVTFSLSDVCIPKVENVFSIKEDHNGVLWVGTWDDGLIRYDPSVNGCTVFNSAIDGGYGISGNDIKSIYIDSKNRIWISIYGRGFDIYDQTTQTFQNFQPIPLPNGLADGNIINTFFEDTDGQVWIGSKGGGLLKFNPQNKEFVSYNNQSFLLNKEVNSILQADNGNLWIGTNYGLYQFNPSTSEVIHYGKNSGLNGNNFGANSALIAHDGGMYFGGRHGFNYFHPDSLVLNDTPTNLKFIDFKIFNKTVDLSQKEGTDKNIVVADKVVLSNKESVFSIEFAALNFINPADTEYKYRLVGFDHDWISSDALNRTVTYTNLDHGEYEFQVLATNGDGKWNDALSSIKIVINPPFWQTTWFRVIALTMVIVIIVSIHNLRLKYLNNRNTLLELEIKERTSEIALKNHELTETIEELNATQTQLILSEKMAALGQLTASVAHEINTPLGAINGAVATIKVDLPEIIQEFPLLSRIFTDQQFNAFSEILENAEQRPILSTLETRRLRKDIKNELLAMDIKDSHTLASYLVDLNADLESNAYLTLLKHDYAVIIFQTAAKITNILNLTDNIGTSLQQASKVAFALKKYSYTSQADLVQKFDISENILNTLDIFKSQLQNTDLNLDLPEGIYVEGQPSELSQVWLNLIQNSLHAINGKGRIDISLSPNGRQVTACIKDNGIGITEEIKEKIFDPFFTTKPYGQGSGLGLDIVNRIIKRHDGAISFDSDDTGTVFKVVLPYDYDRKE